MFHSQSVGQINTELKNNTILLSFKKELFGAKKTASTSAKNDCFYFLASKHKHLMFCQFFGGTSKDKIDDQYKFILKRMKVSYDRYETLLHVCLTLIPSDKF